VHVRWVTVEDGRPAGKVFRKFADCIERGMYNLMWRRDSRDVWVEGDILGGIKGFRKEAYSYKTKDCLSCNVSHNNMSSYIYSSAKICARTVFITSTNSL